MLRIYTRQDDRLVLASEGDERIAVWLDLLNPTDEEDAHVQSLLGIDIPSRAEMEEIELSSRLYLEAAPPS